MSSGRNHLAMVTGCVMLVCCGTLSAEIIHSGVNFDVEISEPVAVGDGSERLLMFQLMAVGKNELLPAGFDGTIRGPLHQQSAADVITPSLDEPLDGSLFLTDIDTHFGISNADLIAVFALTETLGTAESSRETADATGPEAATARTSLGTSLSGTFARIGELEQRWLLAQIVVPGGSTIDLDFELGLSGGSVENVVVSFDVGSRFIIGDLTRNGFVDFNDLAVLLSNWDTTVGPPLGNLVNADETPVNFDDLAVLLSNWTGPEPAGAPQLAADARVVPEPSSLVLLGFGAMVFGLVRRRR